jgi:hypothetical protein
VRFHGLLTTQSHSQLSIRLVQSGACLTCSTSSLMGCSARFSVASLTWLCAIRGHFMLWIIKSLMPRYKSLLSPVIGPEI